MQGRVDKEKYDLYKEVEAEINVGLKVRIKDENDNVLHEDDGHCYTWQFMRMVIALMAQDTNLTITSANSENEPNADEPYIPIYQKTLDGSERGYWGDILGNNVDSNSWKIGILLETWDDTDNNALTQVTPYHMWKPYKSSYHNTGVINRDADGGPLEYKETQYGDITDDIANGVWKFTVSRQVINQSTSDVIVKAMSLNTGTQSYYWDNNDSSPFGGDYATRQMIMRDIITSTDSSLRTVSANGGTLNFEYEIRIEGSNGDGTGYWTLLRGMIMRIWQQMTQNSSSKFNFNVNKMDWWKNNHGEHGMIFSTDNNPIDPTNYRPSDMVNAIPDGEESGELKYYPPRVLIPDDGEPNGKGFVENVFKAKNLTGDINSSASTLDVIRTTGYDGSINTDATYTDSDISDFTTDTNIAIDDYIYDTANDTYYKVTGVTSAAINLGSSPVSTKNVTVDILKSNIDFTNDVKETDLIYVRSTQTYYTIAMGGISKHTIALGEAPPADLTGVVDIIDNTDPRTEIVISGVAENKSGGQIDAYKMYLNDDNEGNTSATLAGKHFSSSPFTFSPGDLGRCDLRIILTPDN